MELTDKQSNALHEMGESGNDLWCAYHEWSSTKYKMYATEEEQVEYINEEVLKLEQKIINYRKSMEK